jgi:cobalt-zinc-cadmium efflux system protein
MSQDPQDTTMPGSNPDAEPAAGAAHNDGAAHGQEPHEHAEHEQAAHEQAAHEQAAHEQAAHEQAAHEHESHDHAAQGHEGHDHDDGGAVHTGAVHTGAVHTGAVHTGDMHTGDAHAGHHHGHGHSHAGHHHHGVPPDGKSRAFAIAVALNIGIVVLQAVYGFIAHSTALLADAGHNLSDVLGLVLAWGAIFLARRKTSARFTYGLRGSSILASLANAALLCIASGAIAWEAILRLMEPSPVGGVEVFAVAAIGLLVNGFSAWLFMSGSKDDLNVRGAFLHMLGDAGVSAGVAVSGLVILFTGWYWVDPAMSLVVVAVVLYGTWGLLTESVKLALGAVPGQVNTQNIARYLARLPGVTDTHDLHVWALSTTENSMTVHLVMPGGHPGDTFIDQIVAKLAADYAVHHTTIQIDLGTSDHHCALDARPS